MLAIIIIKIKLLEKISFEFIKQFMNERNTIYILIYSVQDALSFI